MLAGVIKLIVLPSAKNAVEASARPELTRLAATKPDALLLGLRTFRYYPSRTRQLHPKLQRTESKRTSFNLKLFRSQGQISSVGSACGRSDKPKVPIRIAVSAWNPDTTNIFAFCPRPGQEEKFTGGFMFILVRYPALNNFG